MSRPKISFVSFIYSCMQTACWKDRNVEKNAFNFKMYFWLMKLMCYQWNNVTNIIMQFSLKKILLYLRYSMILFSICLVVPITNLLIVLPLLLVWLMCVVIVVNVCGLTLLLLLVFILSHIIISISRTYFLVKKSI